MASLRSRARRTAFPDYSRSSSQSSGVTNSQRSSPNTSPQRDDTPDSCGESCCKGQHSIHETTSVTVRTNRAQKIHRSECPQRFIQALQHDGCVVVQGFAGKAILDQANREVLALLNDGDRHKANSGILTHCVSLSPTVRSSFCEDKLFQVLCDELLTLRTTTWENEKAHTLVSQPHVSTSASFDMTKGLNESSFHRSDSVHHTRHSAAGSYKADRDTSLAIFIPGFDLTSSRVGVHTIPGSHLWGDDKPDLTNGVVDIELKEGDAVIVLGSLYHRLMACQAECGQAKMLHAIWMCSDLYQSKEPCLKGLSS